MDAFDNFLQTYASKDLQVLVSEEAARAQQVEQRKRQRPVSPKQPPKQKARPAVRPDPADDGESDDTEPPDVIPEAVASSDPSPSPDMKEVMEKLADLTKKVHNQGRGGRNRIYYEILNTYGPKAAAPFWRPPAFFASSSSSSSSAKVASQAVPPVACQAGPPWRPPAHPSDFEPNWWATSPPAPKSMPASRPLAQANVVAPKFPNSPWWSGH
jgi:hypothetical protein